MIVVKNLEQTAIKHDVSCRVQCLRLSGLPGYSRVQESINSFYPEKFKDPLDWNYKIFKNRLNYKFYVSC